MHARAVMLGCLLAAVVGCGGSIPQPTDQHTAVARSRWPDTTRQSLVQGRALYIDHCGGCHPLYEPGRFTAAEWSSITAEMAPRAKLAPGETDLVRRYLVVLSKP